MTNGNVVLVVDKVHPKNKSGYTVGVRIETKLDNGMKITKYASVKYDRKPKLGTKTIVNKVETERNAEGFNWIVGIE